MIHFNLRSLHEWSLGGWSAAGIPYLLNSLSTVVQSHKISSLYIKAIQILHRLLSVEDVFVYDEGRALLFCGFAFSNLTDCTEPPKHIVQLF